MPKLLRALDDFRIVSARLAQSGEIAFHVRHENRNAARAEIFRERLQRNGLSRAGGAGDQPVPVRHFRQEIDWLLCLRDEDGVVRHKTPRSTLNAVSA